MGYPLSGGKEVDMQRSWLDPSPSPTAQTRIQRDFHRYVSCLHPSRQVDRGSNGPKLMKVLHQDPSPGAGFTIAFHVTPPSQGEQGRSRPSKSSMTGFSSQHCQLPPCHRGDTRTPTDLFSRTMATSTSHMQISIWATLWSQNVQEHLRG